MDLQAVIFDYGEVLSDLPDKQRHSNLVAIANVAEEGFDKSYWAHRLEYDGGILNDQTYWATVARENGTSFTPAQIEQLMEQDALMWMNLNPRMLDWIPRIKAAGLKLAILSNMPRGVKEYMLPRFAWLKEFDYLTWSCDLGVVKPDPAIYLHTVKKLGVHPKQALFIDNLEKNTAGAEAAGLLANIFRDVDQLQADLSRRGFPLPALV